MRFRDRLQTGSIFSDLTFIVTIMFTGILLMQQG